MLSSPDRMIHTLHEALSITPESGQKVHGSGQRRLRQVDPRRAEWLHNDGSISVEPEARVHAFDPYANGNLGIVAGVFRGLVQAGKLELAHLIQEDPLLLGTTFRFDLKRRRLVCTANEAGWQYVEAIEPSGMLYGLKPAGFEQVRHESFDPPDLACKYSSGASAEVANGPTAVGLDTIAALGDLIVIHPLPRLDFIRTLSDPPVR